MLIYSGDSDGVCATVGSQSWVYEIGGSKISQGFRPWRYASELYGEQQGGMHVAFEVDSDISASTAKLHFATVHYAGEYYI